MEATEILAIPVTQPERLFPNSVDETKQIYRNLARVWHSDYNKAPEAAGVFSHLTILYDLALDRIQAGKWSLPNTLVIRGIDGKVREIKYRRKRTFELGEFAYGDRVICYVVKPEFKALFNQGVKTIKESFVYKDKKIKDQMEKYLPHILDSFEADDGRQVLVLAKTPDVFLLQDILDLNKGTLDPKHVAWIISCVHNLACYLKTAGLTHNAINATTLFVSPQHHSCLLLGGWWYAQKAGHPISILPRVSVDVAPTDIITGKIADPRLDLMLVRQLGLDCLGDHSGMILLHDGKTPKSMVEFLRGSSKGNAFEDYQYWQENTLVNSFGKRRFAEMKVESSDVYKE